ncbi:MAG: hypothetical protein ACK6CO_01205 [Cyanobacteriota bacterium]
MGQVSRVALISTQRLEQLGGLLARLGLDPLASGGPGAGAAELAPIEPGDFLEAYCGIRLRRGDELT